MNEAEVLFKEESYRIMGACFEVYNVKGCGFLEPVYQDCLQIEFRLQNIPAIPKAAFPMEYKGEPIGQHFEPDFLCFHEIVVELKAVSQLVEKHRAQVMNYLKATQKRLGLLVNFSSHPKLEYERIVAHDAWTAQDLHL
jgi:GxxExxY protein